MPSEKNGKITHLMQYPAQVVIYYEGGVSVWSKDAFQRHPVEVGQYYLPDEHDTDSSSYDALLAKAYQWLAIRDYPYIEMQRKLADATPDAHLVDPVMKTLIERHLIDDEQYAYHQLEKAKEMGYGSLHLKSVLIEKGIPTHLVENVVSAYDEAEERQLAHTLIGEWMRIAALRQKAPAPFAVSLLNRLKTRGFKEDILIDLQETILTETRRHSVYDIQSQLDVYKRLKFSAYKMSAKLRALGYDEDVIQQLIEEVHHD